MEVNCQASVQTLNVFFLPEMDYKHTCATIYTYFYGIADNNIVSYDLKKSYILYMIYEGFVSFHHTSTHISNRPKQVLPVQMPGGRVSA